MIECACGCGGLMTRSSGSTWIHGHAPTKIMVCGDVHGNWRHLNMLINRRKPDIILQCGDYGYWPNFHNIVGTGKKKWDLYGIKTDKTDIYFCDGNHENFWELKKLKSSGNIVKRGVFYMDRGSTLELPDGRNVLFFGGAKSTDKEYRRIGVDWFPEETISTTDLDSLPDEKVDIVISHTCPEEFDMGGWEHTMTGLIYKDKLDDPSRKALSYILKKYEPSLWYFAHFHEYKEGSHLSCKWKCLNMANCTGWWEWLK